MREEGKKGHREPSCIFDESRTHGTVASVGAVRTGTSTAHITPS
jgi:hypothetical protein